MCIKPFTFNNTIFSVSFLNDISPFNIFFEHTVIELHLKIDRRHTADWMTQQTFISDILPNAPIFHSSVAISL